MSTELEEWFDLSNWKFPEEEKPLAKVSIKQYLEFVVK